MIKPLPPIPEDVSSYFFMRMCTDAFADDASEWYDFMALENLPPYSCVYELNVHSPIEFRYPDGTEGFQVIELPLQAAIETMEKEERFNVNPLRWNRVIRDLSEGWCYYPWMTRAHRTRPELQDGRHRILVMMKLLGMKSAPFVVAEEDVETVKAWTPFQLSQPVE
ncbi:hypothetical protein ACT3OH_02990 [Vreelandella zhanjiangensis]|uniref:hypothetical protein n=1 Tax=Vreelandella zhanjiangensis TaxID=1121960 RepID=UPI00402A8DD5